MSKLYYDVIVIKTLPRDLNDFFVEFQMIWILTYVFSIEIIAKKRDAIF